ncbi:dystrobrevin binding protein 1 L homeolog isoform X1 [Xenopus laevis]|uniref:Dystrobrevin binding protein 1 L homeolog isoform X1 n=2 Tax=Xenopus laevis TaxID=8355 RepID=A0A8J0VHN9_XENLA|nr:dystrobrevin binding protein 1 L homeolog isoform X1 [Xenopus laevis]
MMFGSLRERLLSVQQDFTSGLKSLGDKSREVKIKKQYRPAEQLSKFPAGAELLNRYEDNWAALHKVARECAIAGEQVDGELVMLSAHWEKKRNSLVELQEQLQQVPGFIADLESVTAKLVALEGCFEDVERNLLELEDLCEQCELQRFKHVQYMQLEQYKKSKRKELENFKAELDAEHTQRVLDMEHAQQMKLKERQKFFEEAFQQDMEQYLSSGYLQISERREPIGSMSSMEVNVDMLEQMDLMDMSDQEALDVFLNSGAEENSVLSPMIEPEFDCRNEITLQVPSQAELRHKLSSLSSTCTDSASPENSEDGGESPVVQSDDDDVLADSVLTGLDAIANTTSDVSDESDTRTA